MIIPALVAVLFLVPPPEPKASAFPGERVVTSETPEVSWPPATPEQPTVDDGVELVVHEPSWKLQRMRLSEMPENVREGADRVGANSISYLQYQWWVWNDVVWNYEVEPGAFEAYVIVTHVHAETRLHTDLFALPETDEPQIALERGYHDISLAYFELMEPVMRQTLADWLIGQRMVGYGATEQEAEDDAIARLNAIADAAMELAIYDRRLDANERYFELTDRLTNVEVDVPASVRAALGSHEEGDAQWRYERYGHAPRHDPAGMPQSPVRDANELE